MLAFCVLFIPFNIMFFSLIHVAYTTFSSSNDGFLDGVLMSANGNSDALNMVELLCL